MNNSKDLMNLNNLGPLPEGLKERSISVDSKTNCVSANQVTQTPKGIIFEQVTKHPDGSLDQKKTFTPSTTLTNKSALAERVQNLRADGLTQTQTAKATGRSQSTISRMENNK